MYSQLVSGSIQELKYCHGNLSISSLLSSVTVSFSVRPFSYGCKDGTQQFQASSHQATLVEREYLFPKSFSKSPMTEFHWSSLGHVPIL